MNDPHVVLLKYKLVTDPDISYAKAAEVRIESRVFIATLSNNCLSFEFKKDFTSVEQAKEAVTSFIRNWEFAGLEQGLRRDQFSFVFDCSQVEDRNPAPGEVSLSASVHMRGNARARIQVEKSEYPKPRADLIEITDDVEILWSRYEQYLAGKEPLQSMAFACLRIIESKFGGGKNHRKNASRHLNVKEGVLGKLGELTSDKGDMLTGRKPRMDIEALSEDDKRWTKNAVVALILRVGQIEHANKLAQLDSTDFMQ